MHIELDQHNLRNIDPAAAASLASTQGYTAVVDVRRVAAVATLPVVVRHDEAA